MSEEHLQAQQCSQGFSLLFGGKPNEIDSRTLGVSLVALTNVIDQINEDLHTGAKVELRVKTPVPGSYELPFDLVLLGVAGVLSTIQPGLIPDIIKILAELIKLKLGLKGQQPKAVETIDAQTTITNEDGTVTYVDNRTYNIYSRNAIVNAELEKKFQALHEDQRVTHFQLRDAQNTNIIAVPRDDFHHLTTSTTEVEKPIQTQVEKTELRVFKVVFDRRFKWDFIYRGMRISARILDDDFLKQVDTGKRFGKGDVVRVELRINKAFDSSANTFIHKSYDILKVFKHIPREEQLTLWPGG